MYTYRKHIYSITDADVVVEECKTGKKIHIPLSSISEVRIWMLNIESGCRFTTRGGKIFTLRCGFLMNPDYVAFVMSLHLALLNGGHHPTYVRGNKTLFFVGWVFLALCIGACSVVAFTLDYHAIVAMSFFRIALLFCMIGALMSLALSAIRSGRSKPYHAEDLLPLRKRVIAKQKEHQG